ncbi:LysR family transcriptional regulator [Affinibrenneria salicis]|uniref:LysR family transcriptional regulator n=2 Tax=Affinibrenneria salicis TaxID=2590031 RepID=A0A5J5G287_9GAMM|nr:LysR family transcriptional regulator [Affinibrenneria salicis]
MHTFIRIVEAGSLSAAAARLNTTQPTVSRRLQSLERLLGLKLVMRTTHVMKLTADGERCYAHARQLLDSWLAIEDDLRGSAREPTGTLRVLVPHAFGQDQMIKPLRDYLLRYPQISVEWMLSDRHPDFMAESIDCAVHVGAVSAPDVVAVLVAEVPRIVIAAPALFDGRDSVSRPQQLGALPWLALSTFYRNEVVLQHESRDERCRIDIQPRFMTDSLYALRNSALAGMGVGVLSAWMARQDIAVGRLLRLMPHWQAAPLPVYLVYPYARYYPAKLRLFLDMMRQVMPALIGTRQPGG